MHIREGFRRGFQNHAATLNAGPKSAASAWRARQCPVDEAHLPAAGSPQRKADRPGGPARAEDDGRSSGSPRNPVVPAFRFVMKP